MIESGTPDEVMFNVFKRINTGGITLNGQEIRHALNPGPARNFLTLLAESKPFKEATGNSVRDDRMGARELALRFCAFWLTPPNNYHGGDLDGFLNDAMKRLNMMTHRDFDILEEAFTSGMRRSTEVLGLEAFRKPSSGRSARSPINRALFEAWSVCLSKISAEEYERVLSRRVDVVDSFAHEFYNNYEFERSISISTGSRSRVVLRFGVIQKIIQGAIHA